jgi:opacity protein-like surface antigen
MRRALLSTVTALLVAVSMATAAGAETVWSALVMANNRAEPTPMPRELTRLEGTLQRFFNYNQYQVIGSSRQTLTTGDEDWQTTSKYFTLKVNGNGSANAAYRLNLQLFQQQKLLFETEANLSKRSPLVIRGPMVGDGQLVLLLVVE